MSHRSDGLPGEKVCSQCSDVSVLDAWKGRCTRNTRGPFAISYIYRRATLERAAASPAKRGQDSALLWEEIEQKRSTAKSKPLGIRACNGLAPLPSNPAWPTPLAKARRYCMRLERKSLRARPCAVSKTAGAVPRRRPAPGVAARRPRRPTPGRWWTRPQGRTRCGSGASRRIR